MWRGIIGVFLSVPKAPLSMAEMPTVFLATIRLQSRARAGNRSLGLFLRFKSCFGRSALLIARTRAAAFACGRHSSPSK
jgi:hypothetical protein